MEEGLSPVHDLVEEGVSRSGIPLSRTLHHYLCITVLRFLAKPIQVDALTLRLVQAFDARAPAAKIRILGDECLIACALFEERLRRAGGSLRHYGGLGRTAYEAAGLTEQALGFSHMRDVLCAATERNRGPDDPRNLIDATRMGSVRSREKLRESGVILFRPR
jgi:hypothetical protein